MKKALSLVEVIISIFVLSIMGLFLVGTVTNFFLGLNNMRTIKEFSTNYNNMLNYIYSNGYAGWQFYEANNTGLVVYNSGYVENLTGFIGYDCNEEGIHATNFSLTAEDLNWNDYDKIFTGIACNELTGWNVDGGYWLSFNVSVLETPVDLKYFIKSQ